MTSQNTKRLVSLCVTGFLLVIFIGFDPFWMFEHRVQDAAFQRPRMLHPSIVIIGIDEAALDTFGRMPQWSRHIMSKALHILNADAEYRPAVIGVDVLFSEADADPVADAALEAAVAEAGNVVLVSALEFGFDFDTMQANVPLRHNRPFPGLRAHAPYGLVNAGLDRDGVMRHGLLHMPFRGERLYAFPVVVAAAYLGAAPGDVVPDSTHTYIRFASEPGYPGEFFGFSFAELFAPDFDPWWVADAIVLIGAYAVGMGDQFIVSADREIPMFGIDILANTLQVVLEGYYASMAPGWLGALVTAVLLVLAMALGEWLDIRLLLAVLLGLGTGYYFLAQFIFAQGYVMPLLVPGAAMGMVFLYQLVCGYLLRTLEKNHMRRVFGKYVDPKLADVLINSKEADSHAVGQKKNIAVVFVDVRGFTPMTERLKDSPERVVEILNNYLQLTATSVFTNGGSVDKFIGDATMALFNGFVPLDDYVYKAVKAAWDMVQGAAAVNAQIMEREGIQIGFGVGVHCGDAIVGNLGADFRKDYTAIGDTVNTAARLESQASASQVLVSRAVYEELQGRIQAESIGEISLKGKQLPMEVFSLTGIKE